MSDRPALEQLLTQRSADYKSCHAKLVLETNPSRSSLVQGTLVFQDSKVGPSKNDLDYGAILLMNRTFTFDEGRQILQDIFANEFTPKLMHSSDVMINRHPDEWRPGPQNLPVAFGAHPRFSAWPERVFLFRAEHGGQLPRPPITRRGLPSILSNDSLMRSWLGLDPRSLAASTQTLRVVLPDYRARIVKVSLKRGRLAVHFEAGTTKVGSLSLVTEFARGDKVHQLPLPLNTSPAEAELPEFPPELYVFLHDTNTDEVVDWAHINPFASIQPEGIEAELPPSVLEDAMNKREGQHVEFKKGFSRASPDEVLNTVIAFSNADGGQVFVGISDKLEIVGVSDIDKMGQRIREICHELLEPPITVTTAPTHLEGRDVLVVTVPEGEDKPYRYRRTGQYLIRKGETDRGMTRSDMDAAYRTNMRPAGRNPGAFL